jgi:hypothetical protein
MQQPHLNVGIHDRLKIHHAEDAHSTQLFEDDLLPAEYLRCWRELFDRHRSPLHALAHSRLSHYIHGLILGPSIFL